MDEPMRREFFNLCQVYRHAPFHNSEMVYDAYEELILWVDKYADKISKLSSENSEVKK